MKIDVFEDLIEGRDAAVMTRSCGDAQGAKQVEASLEQGDVLLEGGTSGEVVGEEAFDEGDVVTVFLAVEVTT